MRHSAATLVATVVIGAGLLGVAGVPSANAASHPSYPLGKAKSCRAHYVKRTERHKVKGKEVRYVACVYVAPPSAPPVPQYSVDLVSMSPIENGLPVEQDVTVSALVTDPQNPKVAPIGKVTFASNGAPLSSCRNEALVPNEFNGVGFSGPFLSAASCTLSFSTAGLSTLTATVTETTGATDVGTLGVDVVP